MDDEPDLREAVAEYLERRDLRVLQAGSAGELRDLAEREFLDIAVLDIAMPGEDGLSVARWLRARGSRPRILFATAAGSAIDRIVGLEIGADDYVVKPYDLRELAARIRSLLRWMPEHSPREEAEPVPLVVRVGAFSFDPRVGRLDGPGGESFDLTLMEAQLLAALVARPNRVLSRSHLQELAHGRDADGDDRNVDVRINRLRRKVEADPSQPRLIRTVRGEGYTFVPDP
ncbi:response regulator [Roseomonas sp. CCTCC AB2023176]|uniref:response regulator n=1 Tax=Roseomonas sp. CCTCC AB2023176 TaxID=3342640 RepID=UPI0035DBECB1